jgi:hypothetical protein
MAIGRTPSCARRRRRPGAGRGCQERCRDIASRHGEDPRATNNLPEAVRWHPVGPDAGLVWWRSREGALCGAPRDRPAARPTSAPPGCPGETSAHAAPTRRPEGPGQGECPRADPSLAMNRAGVKRVPTLLFSVLYKRLKLVENFVGSIASPGSASFAVGLPGLRARRSASRACRSGGDLRGWRRWLTRRTREITRRTCEITRRTREITRRTRE